MSLYINTDSCSSGPKEEELTQKEMTVQPFFISDNRNNVLRYINSSGTISTPALTSTDSVYLDLGGFGGLWSIAFDAPRQRLIVVDEGHEIIWAVDTSTWAVTRVAGGGGSGALGYDFRDIYEVAVDSLGNVYVSEPSNQILAVNMQGTTQTILGVSIGAGDIAVIAGGGASGYSGDGGPALLAKMRNPYGLACDADDNLYFCDQSNDIIRKVDTSGIITTVAGTPTSPGFSGDGGSPTSAQLNAPLGVSFDAAGNMFIADFDNDRVRVVNNQATPQTICGTVIAPGTIETIAGSMDFPLLWFAYPDETGNVFLGNIPRGVAYIQRIDATGAVTLAAGTGTPGHSGDGGPATSALIGEAFGLALVPSAPTLSVSPTSFSPSTVPPGLPFVNYVWQMGEDLVSRDSQTLNITCSGDWSIAVDNPYLIFDGHSTLSRTGNTAVTVGIGPATDVSGLPLFPLSNFGGRIKPGVYTCTISLQSGSDTVTIPANIQIGYGDNLQ